MLIDIKIETKNKTFHIQSNQKLQLQNVIGFEITKVNTPNYINSNETEFLNFLESNHETLPIIIQELESDSTIVKDKYASIKLENSGDTDCNRRIVISAVSETKILTNVATLIPHPHEPLSKELFWEFCKATMGIPDNKKEKFISEKYAELNEEADEENNEMPDASLYINSTSIAGWIPDIESELCSGVKVYSLEDLFQFNKDNKHN